MATSSNQYWAYGLRMASEFVIPELVPYPFSTPDVIVRSGKVDTRALDDFTSKDIAVSFSPEGFIVNARGIARYHVSGGNSIIVERDDNAPQKSVNLFLLSTAMAALLLQRGLLPFHASAIRVEGGLALFCGASKAGKSTTTQSLAKNGHTLFSDDVCVLKEGGEQHVVAYASYPGAKLWEDTYAKLGMDIPAESRQIRPGTLKYSKYFHEEFSTEAFPVKRIFVLGTSDAVDTPQIERLGAIDAFSAIAQNDYRPYQTSALQRRDVFFHLVSRLVNSCEVYRVTRPASQNTVEELASLLQPFLR